MRKVILESPYAGDVEQNVIYAMRCMQDSLNRGEAPMISHLLYTQCLDDRIPEERELGINAGHAWLEAVDAVVVYADRGISAGMQLGIERAEKQGKPVFFRSLGGDEWQQ